MSLTTDILQRTFDLYSLVRAMEEVTVTELRQNLQAFLTKVSRGTRLRVTSRGRVIAEITPPSSAPEEAEAARARLRGSVLQYADPTAPAMEPGEWEMNR
jgi:prevent-host-death family protein